tara:strand:- start:202 stop:567 length:366 start_codon:yes stop_codon:yes gene_type:complete
MKKILALLAIVFIASAAIAQDNKKNTYFLEGDLIEATIYHENGVVAQTGFYTKDNKLTGEWISYDVKGNLTAIAEYNEGEKVGTWVFIQGNIQREVTYIDSRIAKVATWRLEDTYVVSNNP